MNTTEQLIQQLRMLKQAAGSHSPSLMTIKEKLPEINLKVDACFLSNPYATELFLEYFKKELIDTGALRDMLEFYPSQNKVIAELLANTIGMHYQNVFIGNGAIEIIQTILQRFTKKKIIINIPTFSSYYEFVNENVEVVYHKLTKENNFEIDVEKYIALARKEKPDTVVFINPNNPDGGYIKKDSVLHLLRELKDVGTFILDESFIHFAYEGDSFDQISASQLIHDFPNLVIVKSMSKDFGIAGIRAGYAVMSTERVSILLKNGFLWNSNGLSEYFFRLYTRKEFLDEYEKVRIRYIKETQEFISSLQKVPKIKVYGSMANFALVELLTGESSDDFVFKMLVKHGIYLRTCSDKIGLEGEFIRMASRKKDENKYILNSFTAELQ